MFKFLFALSFTINLFSSTISSDDNYRVFQSKKYNIIYTQDYEKEAIFIKDNLDDFIQQNDKNFGYSFDEPLRIVLISNNNQIPNAFSTQVPFNLGVYFNGGSKMNDYFTSSSWLETLFVHEMVHNYQINAKKSKISKTLHKFLGNNYMPVWAMIPFFTLPNLLLPTALLEGNAVLNETLYGNGGRLYSGRFNALKNSLIFDNKITPSRFLNNHIDFPYTQEKYIVGGYYMLYLSEIYGLGKVNQFFYKHSIHSINPFLLNNTFYRHFQISFEQSIYNFVQYTKNKYKNYKQLEKHNILSSSKDEVYLSKVNNKIYYIASDLINDKNLNIYDINTKQLTSEPTKFNNGKIFIKDDKRYVANSSFVSPSLYKNGLFDENNYILKNTQGKAVEDIYKEQTAYINIKESFLTTKLYINDKFYSKISSSALFDNSGNIYYFKQNGTTRILYKNKQKIYEFRGFYSKIVDIVDDDIYFISNTKNGSGLYKYSKGKLYLLNQSDNIINAKICTKNSALVVSVTSNWYDIGVIDLKTKLIDNIAVASNINLANKYKLNTDTNITTNKIDNSRYNEFKQLQFSMLYPTYSYDTVYGSQYTLNALFMDPVMFNILNIYGYKIEDLKVAGVKYTNERYMIPFSANIYNTSRDIKSIDDRGYGGSLKLYQTLLKKGRHNLDISLRKSWDDQNKNKNPTTISANHTYKEKFILGILNSFSSDLESFVKEDRGDLIYGLDYKINKLIYNEFYINGQLKSINSDVSSLGSQRGTKVVITQIDALQDNTKVLMEGFDYNFYVKDIFKSSVGISKAINFNYYFSKFPFSLRQEILFYKYNNYQLASMDIFNIKEQIVGVTFDILFAHKLSIPMTIKYIENDLSRDDYKIIFSIGVDF